MTAGMAGGQEKSGGLRILVHGINFYPEPVGTGKYTGEMCFWLASRGHHVRVITTAPWFPDWRVPDSYRGWVTRRETLHGVEVVRVPHWVPQRAGGLKRVLHGAGFALAAMPELARSLFWRPHVVLAVAPSLACAPGALAFAALGGARSWLHLQDFEVDAAFELGLLRGGLLRGIAAGLERLLLRAFSRVSSISERMVERLHNKGVRADRTVHFPNWVDIDSIRPLETPSTYRAQLGIPPQAMVALYAGSMGAKQGLEIMAQAARLLVHDKNLHFVFCGLGAGRAGLEQACTGLERVHWLPLQPLDRLGELLGMADMHLLPQRADAADLVLPSKLTGMLASGRPVIATAHIDTTLGRVLEDCGVLVEPEQPAALAAAVQKLADNPQLRQQLGRRARVVAEQRLSRSALLEAFEEQLLRLRGMERTAL